MLIDKGFTQGDVVSIKLIGGEEIIARFESESATEFVISKPLAVTFNAQGLGLIPWIFLGEDKNQDIKVRQSAITMVCKPKADAAKQYMESTSNLKLV